MWRVYTTAKATHSRPSDLLCVVDRWAAYQLDCAVSYFGMVIENALQEQVNVGPDDKPRWVAKYTLTQLLTPGFKLGGDHEAPLPLKADGMIYDEVS
jgi:hypothetical protein